MHAAAQDCALHTARISGEVRDRSGALVVDAGVLVDGAESLHSDKQGRYTTSCVADGEHTLQIQMDGFEPLELAGRRRNERSHRGRNAEAADRYRRGERGKRDRR